MVKVCAAPTPVRILPAGVPAAVGVWSGRLPSPITQGPVRIKPAKAARFVVLCSPMAVLDDLLQQLGARFASPALEGQYREFRESRYFLKDDGLHGCIRLAILGSLALREAFRNGPTSSTAASFFVLVGPLAQILMKRATERSGGHREALTAYVCRRNAVSFLWRTAVLPVVAGIWFSDFFRAPGKTAAGLHLGAYILLGSGAMPLFITGIGQPLLLEHHLALQPLATILVAFLCGRSFCWLAVEEEAGQRNVMVAWRFLEGISRKVLSAVLMAEIPTEPEPPALPACRQVVLSAYVVLSIAATTYILWMIEHRSRVHFLDVRRMRGLRDGEAGWEPVGSAFVLHGVLAVVGSALVWQATRILGDGGQCVEAFGHDVRGGWANRIDPNADVIRV